MQPPDTTQQQTEAYSPWRARCPKWTCSLCPRGSAGAAAARSAGPPSPDNVHAAKGCAGHTR